MFRAALIGAGVVTLGIVLLAGIYGLAVGIKPLLAWDGAPTPGWESAWRGVGMVAFLAWHFLPFSLLVPLAGSGVAILIRAFLTKERNGPRGRDLLEDRMQRSAAAFAGFVLGAMVGSCGGFFYSIAARQRAFGPGAQIGNVFIGAAGCALLGAIIGSLAGGSRGDDGDAGKD
jgi:hypothetical protein